MDSRARPRRGPDRDGYALLAVTIFIFVLLLSGLAAFNLGFLEHRRAEYRTVSSEAFYLAEGAIERGKAELMRDSGWEQDLAGVALGRGTYDLDLRETSHPEGLGRVVEMTAVGHLGSVGRGIEVVADVLPVAFLMGQLVNGPLSVSGDLDLHGNGHFWNGGRGEPDLTNVHADGEVTTGFQMLPPAVYIEPAHFPGCTYYDVRIHHDSVTGDNPTTIWRTSGGGPAVALTEPLADLDPYIIYYEQYNKFEIRLKNNAPVRDLFEEGSGLFRAFGADDAVVVQFGNQPFIDGIENSMSVIHLYLEGGLWTGPLRQTIINTRFNGITREQRLSSDQWHLHITTLGGLDLAPQAGVAVIASLLNWEGGSGRSIGTEKFPALVYVTRNVRSPSANLTVRGSIFTLGEWRTSGHPIITYDPGYIGRLPGFFTDPELNEGSSGTTKILSWREIPVAGL